MARIYDGGGAGKTESQAELDLKALFEQKLDPSYTVIHSVPWIACNPKARRPKGEVDFVIAHPRQGVLLLEVKGGQIRVEHNRWYTRNRFGVESQLDEDPFMQADLSLYPIREWLSASEHTRRYTYPVFHAVAFPDTGVFSKSALRPDIPAEILLDGSQIANPQKAIEEVFAFWHARYPDWEMKGPAAVEALVRLMVPTADLTASLAEAFRREGKQIEQLTQDQFSILKMLRLQNQAAIVGGAGTGKTVLAMEKARRLVDGQGRRVLFLCFNKNLAAWINQTLQGDSNALLDVLTFHQLTGRMIRNAGLPANSNDKDFNERVADLLQDALDRLRQRPNAQADLYDAIIVDEGQDFRDEWWIPLPDLLKDRDNGIMYIFFDDNQRLYTQLGNIPFKSQPLMLVKNCRNTQGIFTALKPYLPSDDETVCIGPQGRPVEIIPVADKGEALAELQKALQRLTREKVRSEDIILLTPVSKERSMWEDNQRVGKWVLTWNLQTTMADAIRVSTIYQFKGLESPVVILSEMDKAHKEKTSELAYVGLSRARHHVVVLGSLPATQPSAPPAQTN
jgi:hypothetical protein